MDKRSGRAVMAGGVLNQRGRKGGVVKAHKLQAALAVARSKVSIKCRMLAVLSFNEAWLTTKRELMSMMRSTSIR
jgi:hypothetical protein